MIAVANSSRQKTADSYRDLIGLIVEAYHDSLRATLPRLEKLADQVARERRVPIHILDWLLREFSALADALRAHLVQQEEQLFPMIRRACESSDRAGQPGRLEEPLKELMEEAAREDEEAVASVRRAEHCFRGLDSMQSEPLVLKLVKGLRELREDLEEHVKLEANVLFPAVRELLRGKDQGMQTEVTSRKAPGASAPPCRSGPCGPEETHDPFLEHVREEMGYPDQPGAGRALKSVLHALRDRLSVDKAIALGMRLPKEVRRLYYEDWQRRWDRPANGHKDDFLREIAEAQGEAPDRDPKELARNTFRVLAAQIPIQAVEEVRNILPPGEIRSFWPEPAQSAPRAELIVADQETG